MQMSYLSENDSKTRPRVLVSSLYMFKTRGKQTRKVNELFHFRKLQELGHKKFGNKSTKNGALQSLMSKVDPRAVRVNISDYVNELNILCNCIILSSKSQTV